MIPNKYDIDKSGVPEWRVNVFCNGKRVDCCTGYDLDNDFATFLVKDDDGKYIIENEEVKQGIVKGKITIEQIQ